MRVKINIEDHDLVLEAMGAKTARGAAPIVRFLKSLGCRSRGYEYLTPITNLKYVVDGATSNRITLIPGKDFAEQLTDIADGLDYHLQQASEIKQAFPFQVDGIAFLRFRSRALLMDDMGLGKTFQAIQAIPPGSRTVVVCPNIVKLNWHDEIQRFRPDLTPVIINGRSAEFWLREIQPDEVIIVNYECIPENFDFDFDLAIADEAHYLKNAKAKRTKKWKKLTKRFPRVWLLTGTPIQNKPLELWNVLSAGRMHEDAYGSFPQFVNTFNGRKGKWSYEWDEPTPQAYERLSTVALRRRKTEVLKQLPTKTHRTIVANVNIPGRGFRKGDDIHGFSTYRHELSLNKLPTALQVLDEYEEAGEPVVFFSMHKDPVKLVAERQGWTAVHGDLPIEERNKNIKDFQDGKYRGIACTISAAGVGVTLTRASHSVFLDRSFVPAENWQAEDRICRIGQDRGCVYTFIGSDTDMDEILDDALFVKKELIDNTVEKAEYDTELSKLLRDVARMVDAKDVKKEQGQSGGHSTDSSGGHSEGDGDRLPDGTRRERKLARSRVGKTKQMRRFDGN